VKDLRSGNVHRKNRHWYKGEYHCGDPELLEVGESYAWDRKNRPMAVRILERIVIFCRR